MERIKLPYLVHSSSPFDLFVLRLGQVEYFFWIPALVPFFGALLAAGLYILLIELHHPLEYEFGGQEELKDIDCSEASSISNRKTKNSNTDVSTVTAKS